MATNAKASAPAPEASAQPSALPQPLDQVRVSPQGDEHRNPHPLWVSLPNAGMLDDFLARPALYLKEAGRMLRPYTLVHIIDDATTVFTTALITLVRGSGPHVVSCEIKEIGPRVQLRPAIAMDAVASDGWSVAHMGTFKGWCVLHNGEIRYANLPSEAAARATVNSEIANTARRR